MAAPAKELKSAHKTKTLAPKISSLAPKFKEHEPNHNLCICKSFPLRYAFNCISMKKEKKYNLRVRLWLEETNGIFLGIGRVILLENIGKTGSITNAAKEMKMSYRQAWQFVEDMNKYASEPLVEKMLGGKNGGGAKLTNAGERAIKSFYTLENKIRDFAHKEATKIKF